MSSHKHQDQPGLEVAPEPDLPQVVEGPTVQEKSHDNVYQYAYEQQPQVHQAEFYQNAYQNGAYPPSGYAPSQSAVGVQGQPYWSNSPEGTHVTDGSLPKPLPPPPSGGKILGLRKKMFWLIFGPLIALLVIGLAVGLGVGLGASDGTDSSAGAAPTSTAPTPIACPKANGTTYEASGDHPFLVLCNVDYNGNGGGGTTDMGNKETNTVEDCFNACAETPNCAGAGWGNYYGSTTCWMKGSLGSPNNSPNWFFAIRK
ncbi:hypothetical protein GGR52DRAFT_314317 [Hypoxylon sp. FL1284]|nr:hypothetical protein GGR52DRAFT_314317 [Hypoxylon sp. FL1284]